MGFFSPSTPAQNSPVIKPDSESPLRATPESAPTTKAAISSPLDATPNNPAETGYDPATPWTNVFNILTNRMTQTRKELYREDAYIANEATDIARTEAWRDYLFSYSPIIRFLNENIKDLNGDLGPHNVVCRRCPTRVVVEEFWENSRGQRVEDANNGLVENVQGGEGLVKRRIERRVRQGGGFSPDHGILVCANEMRSQGHMEDTLAHEMVHAWDHARFKVDWGDLKHAACTEIRASMLSGECRWTREFFTRNNWKLTQQFQHCVRSRAIRSVMNRPNCKDEKQASKVVNEVWDSCFADTRPFDEVYK